MPPAAQALLEETGRQVMLQRTTLGMTQAAVADRAGINRATVNRLERGRAVEGWALVLVLEVLGMPIERPRPTPQPSPVPDDRAIPRQKKTPR